MKLKTALLAFLCTAFAAAPAYANEDQLLGTLVGAGVGGYVGSQFGQGEGQLATTAAGVFAGGLIGNELSKSSSPSYGSGYPSYGGPVYFSQNYEPNYVAPPAPEPVTYVDGNDGYCREYSQTVRIGNQVQESYGTACLQPDGTWRIVQ
jgi:surface antigen